MRLCARCGEHPPITPRHKYCSECRDEADREYALRNRQLSKSRETPERRRERYRRETERGRPSAAERGYGPEHRRLRKEWKALIAAGDVACSRCGGLIDPAVDRWHLDHLEDRTGYRGPSHARCNVNSLARPLTRSELARRRAYRTGLVEQSREKTEILYGPEHAKIRKEWEPRVATGTVLCTRCLERIPSDEPWDLGHSDFDYTWTGPEHQRCSRRAGGRMASRRRWLDRAVTSRDWLPVAEEDDEIPTMTSRVW